MKGLIHERLLSILPTRRCPAACTHCGSFSSPNAKDVLPQRVVLEAIKQAAGLDFKLIAFTGGEATLEWEALSRAIPYTCRQGLLTRLVTNAHWAKTRKEARKVIKAFRHWGLNQLNVSYGDEHARFIPLEFIINCLVEGVLADYTIQLMIEFKAKREITKETFLDHPKLKGMTKEMLSKIEITESPWMPLNARRYFSYGIGQTVANNNLALREGCKSILQTYSIEPDGQIVACCGLGAKLIPELAIGHVSENNFLKRAVDRAENDFMKIWLRFEGPEKILAWAAQKGASISWEGKYAHTCQVCHRVYKDPKINKIINCHYREVLANVAASMIIDEKLFPVN